MDTVENDRKWFNCLLTVSGLMETYRDYSLTWICGKIICDNFREIRFTS